MMADIRVEVGFMPGSAMGVAAAAPAATALLKREVKGCGMEFS